MIRILGRGDVVLAPFPFTNLKGHSLRPALVVSQGAIGQDLVLVAISSVVRGHLASMDYAVDVAHPEFGLTGLRVPSVFRLHKLASVQEALIVRRLGCIGPQLQAEIDKLLRVVLGL